MSHYPRARFAPKILDRVELKDKIINGISKAVKKIQEYQFCSGQDTLTLTNTDWQFHKLVENLDHAFLHGLRHITNGYWILVQEFTHRATVKDIKTMMNVTTPLGKGRAWLYIALNENLLECYIKCFMDNLKLTNKYYVKEALVLDQQRMQLMITLAAGLEHISYSLDPDVAYLDLFSHEKIRRQSENDDDPDETLSLHSMSSMESINSSFTYDEAIDVANLPDINMIFDTKKSSSAKSRSSSVTLPTIYDSPTRPDFRSVSFDQTALDQNNISEQMNNEIEVIRVKVKSTNKNKKKKIKKQKDDTCSVSSVNSIQENAESPETPESGYKSVSDSPKPTKTGLNQFEKTKCDSLSSHDSNHSLQTSSSKDSINSRTESASSSRPEALSENNENSQLSAINPSNAQNNGDSTDKIKSVCDSGDKNILEKEISNQNGSDITDSPEQTDILSSEISQEKERDSDCKTGVMIKMESSLTESQIDIYGGSFGKTSHIDKYGGPVGENLDSSQENIVQNDSDTESGDANVIKSDKKCESDSLCDNIVIKQSVAMDTTLSQTATYDVTPAGDKTTNSLGSLIQKGGSLIQKGKDIPVSLIQKGKEIVGNVTGYGSPRHGDNEQPNICRDESFEVLSKEELTDDITNTTSNNGDISVDNNLMLILMLEIFQHEEEQFKKLFHVSTGHNEGDLKPAFLMLTDRSVYVLQSSSGSTARFTRTASATYREIDYVSISLNYQIFNVVCTNRRKQLWICTANQELTKLIMRHMDKIFRSSEESLPILSVLTDATNQRIAIKKWAATECHCQVSEVSIRCYSLVHWEDTQAVENGGMQIGATKEGMLLYKSYDSYVWGSVWKPGYFILKDGMLHMYNDKHDISPPKICIQMNPEECGGCRRCPQSDREHTIQVVLNDGGSLQLSAADAQQSHAWLLSLCHAVSQGMGMRVPGSGCVACCCVITHSRILMCHEDLHTNFFRTLEAANVHDVTNVYTDASAPTYCVLLFEDTDNNTTNADNKWIIYFSTGEEKDTFLEELDHTWTQVFQIPLPVSQIDNIGLQKRCRDGCMKIRAQRSF